jgi:DNA-binding winged helix-turn-helix (wHTH) protein/tetratricopeptide (TPR) repeat protein
MKVFHSFRLDPQNQCLWRGETRIAMTPRAFDVLRYLVEHPGRLVTHEEILDALWPRRYVNQEVVKKYILDIRKVLGDRRHDPIFIETLPRRGYQFVAQVNDDMPAQPPTWQPATTIVGREAPLASLQALLGHALQGQRQIVFITGEPGIGKTTLLDAFHQHATRVQGLRVARGQCVEGFGGKEPYYPLLDALGRFARDSQDTGVLQTLATRAPTWLIQFPALVTAAQRDALHRDIVGATRERMVREICEALDALAASAPLALLLEDLQWADPSTLDVVSALARRRESARLALLATHRPLGGGTSPSALQRLERDLLVHGLCAELALGALAASDIERYLTAELGGRLQPTLPKLIHERSGGNPLFMAAIVAEMRAKARIVEESGTWILSASPDEVELGVPATLQRMLELQFDDLSIFEQSILEAASVCGERFHVLVVASVLETAPRELEDACEGLVARRLFIRAAGIDSIAATHASACYEFSHALNREAIYGRLSDVSRARLHLRIAQRLQALAGDGDRAQELAPDLARHFERGHDYAEAIHYFIASAAIASARFAYRECIRILRHALALAARLPRDDAAELESRIDVLIGDAWYALGAMGESAKSYDAGASQAAAADRKAAEVTALASLVRPLGLIDPDRGIAAVDRAVEVSRQMDDPLLLARTQRLAATVRLIYDAWRNEDAALCASTHDTIRRLGGDESPSYHRMMYGHVLALQGCYATALEIFEEGLAPSKRPVDAIVHFFALSGRTVALLRTGRLGEALRIVRAGQEMAAKNGNDPWLFNFREAWLRILVMDFEGAHALCASMLRADAEYPVEQPQAIARVADGYARLGSGEADQAIECFRQGADPRPPRKFFAHWTWRMTAQLGLCDAWLAKGDLDRATAATRVLLEAVLATSDPWLRALARDACARVAMARQEWNAAQAHLDDALALVSRYSVPGAAWQVHATASEWHRLANDAPQAHAHIDAARAHIRTIADSFDAQEPLRRSFVEAAPVRRVMTIDEAVALTLDSIRTPSSPARSPR